MTNPETLSALIAKLTACHAELVKEIGKAILPKDKAAIALQAKKVSAEIFVSQTFLADIVAGRSVVEPPGPVDIQLIQQSLAEADAVIAQNQTVAAILAWANDFLKAVEKIDSNLRSRQTA